MKIVDDVSLFLVPTEVQVVLYEYCSVVTEVNLGIPLSPDGV